MTNLVSGLRGRPLLMLSAALVATTPQIAKAQSVPAAGNGTGGQASAPTQPVAPVPASGAPETKPTTPATTGNAAGEIVVTGSRIRGSAPVGSSVITIGRQDLSEVAAVSTNELVQSLPQIINQGVSENSRSTAGGAGNITYGSGFNVHGIGPYATLTLLNGRRIVQSGASGGLPDPNDVPTIALQRVDVVADGASAIYGSDAVAGVVNLITRRRFDGLETQVHYGIADGYHDYNAAAIAGHSWATGNITASIEYSGHSSLSGLDRGFYQGNLTARGGNDYRTNQCDPANIVVGPTSYALPGLVAGTSNRCDNLKYADLIPMQRRTSAMASFTQEIGPQFTLFADAFYSDRTFKFTPGVTGANLTVPATNPFFIAPAGAILPLCPASAGAPAGTRCETVAYSFAGQVPPNASKGGAKTYQLTGGATWKPVGDWEVDANYTYGHDKSSSLSVAGLNNGALAAALGSTNQATALNPFSATNSSSVLAGIFNSQFYAPGVNVERQASLSATGTVIRLPGGPLRLAVGGELIHDSIVTGTVTGPPTAIVNNVVTASRNIRSAFGEVLLPIFGADNAVPGIRRLEVSLAGRISHYSDVGTARSPKVGINWTPFDGLKLHGTYGTSFRAPNLTQIHGASSALYVQTYQTPTGPIVGVALSGFKGGNPLMPEKARTWTLGADISPPSLPRLQASINYFNIHYTSQIGGVLSDLTILSSPAIAAQYSSRIVQGAAAATLIQSFIGQGYTVFGALPANPTLFVYGQNFNSGITDARGIDFQLGYRFGAFSIGTNGTVFTHWNAAVSPTAPLLNQLNNIFLPPKFRDRSTLRWTPGDLDLALFVNYIGSYNNNRVAPVQKVRAYTTVDAHVGYTLKNLNLPLLHELTFAVDGTNIFDRDPPFVNIAESSNGGGGFDPTVTNPIGRLISFTVSSKF